MRRKSVATRRSFLKTISGFTALAGSLPEARANGRKPVSGESGPADLKDSPICLNPDGPHYFSFQGKPVILVGSGEHYGSVLNTAFNYSRYLETIANAGLNITRAYSAEFTMRCPVTSGLWRIRSVQTPSLSYVRGSGAIHPARCTVLNKFDLSKWNEAYFKRLW